MTIPAITALPTPPSRGQAPDVFVAAADAFMDALPDLATELNTTTTAIDVVAAEVDADRIAAAASASTATTQAGNASTSAGTATTQAGIATAQAVIATTQAGIATAQAAAAGVSAATAASVIGTSTTSLAIAVASKSFTTQAGKNWQVGSYVIAASAANPANFMFGQVTSYSGTTLIVNVEAVGGSGTLADWNISLSGARGATGATGVGAVLATLATSSPTGTNSVNFTSITQSYSILIIEFDGLSAAAAANLEVDFSGDNGSSWPAYWAKAGAFFDGSDTISGALIIWNYTADGGLALGNAGGLAADGQGSSNEYSLFWRVDGGIDAVRVTTNGGANFDGGTIRLKAL